nr:MAG: nonstructural protein [Microviridae sp.]
MANVIVCALLDRTMQSFSAPITTPNVGVLCRTMSDELKRSTSDQGFAKYPADFDLYQIGTYDEIKGEIIPESPRFLVAVSTLKDA